MWQYEIANRLNEATNILFRVTKRSTRFHCTRERIPHLIWHHHIKVDQNLSDLFQGTHSLEPSIKLKKRLRPSPLLTLKVCFSRQVNVVPPQAAAAKVTVLYVAVHLNLRSVLVCVGGRKSQTNGPVTGAIFFSFRLVSHFALVSSFAQNAAFASLSSYIKRLLCRLNRAWTTTLG